MKQILLLLFLLLGAGAANLSAQSTWTTTNEAKYKSDIRQKLNLDYSMPDYSVKKIDERKMGSHLANILRYFEENASQGTFTPWLGSILSEKDESFKYRYVELKKLKLINVSKTGNEITIIYNVTLNDAAGLPSKVDLAFRFLDGISESKPVNEMFSYICNYVTAREMLTK